MKIETLAIERLIPYARNSRFQSAPDEFVGRYRMVRIYAHSL